MQTVRIETPVADYPAICFVTEDNRAYPFPGIGNAFPHDPALIPNYKFALMKPLDLSRELAFQIARINHHSQLLLGSLASLASINHHLVQQDKSATAAAISHHKDAYGFSLIVLKKDMFHALQHDGLPGLARRQKELQIPRSGWALFCKYVYDLLDPTYDPGRSSHIWYNVLNDRLRNQNRDWYGLPILDDILLLSSNNVGLATVLLRCSGVSLLDLVLLLWRKHVAQPGHAQLRA